MAGQFEGLTPDTWTSFDSLGGVYSVLTLSSGGKTTKYRTLGPRVQGEILKGALTP